MRFLLVKRVFGGIAGETGFTSLPKPLSEFGRDLAEAVSIAYYVSAGLTLLFFESAVRYIRVYKCYRYRKAGLYTQKLGSWDNTGYQKNIGTHHVRHLDPDAPTPGCIPKIRDVRNLIRAGRNAEAQDLCPTGITLRCSGVESWLHDCSFNKRALDATELDGGRRIWKWACFCASEVFQKIASSEGGEIRESRFCCSVWQCKPHVLTPTASCCVGQMHLVVSDIAPVREFCIHATQGRARWPSSLSDLYVDMMELRQPPVQEYFSCDTHYRSWLSTIENCISPEERARSFATAKQALDTAIAFLHNPTVCTAPNSALHFCSGELASIQRNLTVNVAVNPQNNMLLDIELKCAALEVEGTESLVTSDGGFLSLKESFHIFILKFFEWMRFHSDGVRRDAPFVAYLPSLLLSRTCATMHGDSWLASGLEMTASDNPDWLRRELFRDCLAAALMRLNALFPHSCRKVPRKYSWSSSSLCLSSSWCGSLRAYDGARQNDRQDILCNKWTLLLEQVYQIRIQLRALLTNTDLMELRGARRGLELRGARRGRLGAVGVIAFGLVVWILWSKIYFPTPPVPAFLDPFQHQAHKVPTDAIPAEEITKSRIFWLGFLSMVSSLVASMALAAFCHGVDPARGGVLGDGAAQIGGQEATRIFVDVGDAGVANVLEGDASGMLEEDAGVANGLEGAAGAMQEGDAGTNIVVDMPEQDAAAGANEGNAAAGERDTGAQDECEGEDVHPGEDLTGIIVTEPTGDKIGETAQGGDSVSMGDTPAEGDAGVMAHEGDPGVAAAVPLAGSGAVLLAATGGNAQAGDAQARGSSGDDMLRSLSPLLALLALSTLNAVAMVEKWNRDGIDYHHLAIVSAFVAAFSGFFCVFGLLTVIAKLPAGRGRGVAILCSSLVLSLASPGFSLAFQHQPPRVWVTAGIYVVASAFPLGLRGVLRLGFPRSPLYVVFSVCSLTSALFWGVFSHWEKDYAHAGGAGSAMFANTVFFYFYYKNSK
ncbi:hypothetical protein SELMODRAFT_418847 [Selaginella moellendorffii]|uniref:Uncharacterized protein n=1 Tax=Selaginella moellendorffii TaxID=88036 RepID=D8S6K4_SELML|nr:hypothetical protein SELMODRAFT_418847 [Selaginella moellendorffii]